MNPTNFIISVAEVNSVLSYLANCPYKDVLNLVATLQNLRPFEPQALQAVKVPNDKQST